MKAHEKIRQLRENLNWTQEDVAEKLSLSVAGYAKIENGKTHLTLKRLEDFVRIFNVDMLDFLQSESNFFYQHNNDNSNNNPMGQNFRIKHFGENDGTESFKAIIQLKDEIIAQKDKEI
ncbi:MAG: helix-turn-helix transcriptional regulator [Moraxella sp.]|nr:helix-turn-helix transcriptional regulator [Moraxella sp.]